jgi:2',3'-cyclic-nucleotide 2'-phosphodiesterase/3'-nucleotidase
LFIFDPCFEPVVASLNRMCPARTSPWVILVAGCLAVPPSAASVGGTPLNETLGRAVDDLGTPAGWLADGPLWALLHRAQLEATGADVSLATLPDSAARLSRGPITMREVAGLLADADRLVVIEVTGSQLKDVLEQGAAMLAEYTYQDGRSLEGVEFASSDFVAAGGVTYEIDLTHPPGDRVLHLARGGTPVDPSLRLRAVASDRLLGRGGALAFLRDSPRLAGGGARLREALADCVRRRGVLGSETEARWTIVPDYAPTRQRSSIDRLVRQGVAPAAEVRRLFPEQPARRGDLAYWLARAFGWRETRLSGAYPDVPDSLEPWLDGLLKRRVLGALETAERFEPFRVVPLTLVLEWCENAARRAGYDLQPGDSSFRRSLVEALSPGVVGAAAFAGHDTLTVAQLLGLVSTARFPTVRVLETADFHGAMLPTDRDGRRSGGSAVLASTLRRLKSENPEGTVLLDAGDCFQGTMISDLAFGRPVVEQMNALGYTSWAIGNHEFDWGLDTLERRVGEMHCAALAANLRDRSSGRPPPWVRADSLIRRRGVRIGVFGLCYPSTPTATRPERVARFSFDDDSAAAAGLVPRLRRGADLVIGLGHIPGRADSTQRLSGDLARLARGVPGVDLWLGGHSHARVADEIAGVPALIPGAHGEVVALCDLVVDPVGHRVIETRFRLEPTGPDAVIPDSSMLALVERWNRRVAPLAAEPVGRNAAPLRRDRGGESPIGNLVADAIREAAGAELALQNVGGLRAGLPEGVVTRGMIYEVVPFEDSIVTLELTGAEVRRALEEGLRDDLVTQVSGIRYTFDLGAPEFSRVVSITAADGAPFDTTRQYRVACNDFMAGGGDGYRILTRGGHRQDTGTTVREGLEAFVRSRSRDGAALDYRSEGRVARRAGSPTPAHD